jgi:hypothetical protein
VEVLQGSGLQSSRRREKPFNGVRGAEVRHLSGPEKERLEARTHTRTRSIDTGCNKKEEQQLTSTQQRGEAIRSGRAIMMHAGPVHYYCCRRRILDPRPAPNCQLRDSLENHQGPTWARWARCMALGRGRDERPGCLVPGSVGGGVEAS